MKRLELIVGIVLGLITAWVGPMIAFSNAWIFFAFAILIFLYFIYQKKLPRFVRIWAITTIFVGCIFTISYLYNESSKKTGFFDNVRKIQVDAIRESMKKDQ